MQDARFGRAIRALRRRKGLRQVDLAGLAGVPQTTVSLVERGRLERLQVSTIRAVARVVDAEWDPAVRWRGGVQDRLLDDAHAGLVGIVVARLGLAGWDARAEVTFAVYGERGSIDVLAWHAVARMLLVVEVKTSLLSLEETLRRHDTKARLARRVADERFGWRPVGTSSLLVLPGSATARRQVARHGSVLRGAYPMRGAELRRWLREPRLRASGLLFVSPSAGGAAVRAWPTPRRVRVARGSPTPVGRPSPSVRDVS